MTNKNQENKEEIVEVEQPKKKYVVVHDFKDLQDNNKVYIKGDTYPKPANKEITPTRIEELSSTRNKIKKVLIKEQK